MSDVTTTTDLPFPIGTLFASSCGDAFRPLLGCRKRVVGGGDRWVVVEACDSTDNTLCFYSALSREELERKLWRYVLPTQTVRVWEPPANEREAQGRVEELMALMAANRPIDPVGVVTAGRLRAVQRQADEQLAQVRVTNEAIVAGGDFYTELTEGMREVRERFTEGMREERERFLREYEEGRAAYREHVLAQDRRGRAARAARARLREEQEQEQEQEQEPETVPAWDPMQRKISL